MRVAVVGAGVSGLTCGVRLLEEGHQVRIVTRELPPGTTSAVAGAVWFPYRVAPNERTGPWAEASYRRFAALARSWGVRTATYYGPGLYGNRTACGQTLRHRTRGVAHRSLPCGARVPVYRNGLIAIFPVIDRGPHARGVQLDLTHAAARKLGMSTTSAVRAGY